MTELSTTLASDWISPPGDSILDIADERGWSQVELAQRLGYTEKHLSQLINGKVPLSVDAALRLERVVGGTVEFWLSREAQYQQHKARLSSAATYANWVDWLDELPISDLMARGAITKRPFTKEYKIDIVQDCLRFFGVASPKEWHGYYAGMQLAFRKRHTGGDNIGAITSWLRLGEQQAEQLNAPKYHQQRFEKALHESRTLSHLTANEFLPFLRQLLFDVGVRLVIVPAISNARVSGVARWLSPTRPLIQLSLLGKTNDTFWFTFFHEAAHLLLHANTIKEKNAIYLDSAESLLSDSQQEQEADHWAANHLVPTTYADLLPTLRSKCAVQDFAQQLGIHPGIVVGRLQHEGLIPASWMNDLKHSMDIALG